MTSSPPERACPRCHTACPAGSLFCSRCGLGLFAQAPPVPPAQVQYGPAAAYGGYPSHLGRIPNHLAMAIVALVLLWPLGLPAVLNAAKVDSLVHAGDPHGARRASDRAQLWSWWSFGVTAVATLGWVALIVLGAATAAGPAHPPVSPRY